MAHSEIGAIRTLLTSKPRPIGWAQRRQRIEGRERRLRPFGLISGRRRAG
jgi:hypothetical protein